MKKGVLLAAGAIIFLMAAPTAQANTIYVDTGCNIVSTYGLCVEMQGDTTRTYVEDHSPNGETVYRASFTIRPATLNMTSPNNHVVFLAMQTNPSPPPVNQPMIRIVLLKIFDGRFFVRAYAYQNTGAYRFVGGTGLGSNPNTPWKIGLEWTASSAPGANDGILRLYRNDTLQVGRTDLINDGRTIDLARLGCVAFGDASSSGVFHIDSFESFRTLAP